MFSRLDRLRFDRFERSKRKATFEAKTFTFRAVLTHKELSKCKVVFEAKAFTLRGVLDHKNMNIKSVLLCRVSSKEQEESGYSLPAQEKLLRSYTENKGFEATKIFTISESASGKKQRETFNLMFAFVKKNNIKIIVIEKVDRFTRNFKDSVDMYKWLEEDEERQLHSVKDSITLHKNSRSQEKLNWDIRVVFAKNYIDNLSEEVKKGQNRARLAADEASYWV